MAKDQEWLIFIGGSPSHVPFIEAAKYLGFQTIVFDRDSDCKGAKKSDLYFKISTHDIDQIITKCIEINNTKKITGVMTYSSATEPLLAVAKLCKRLGLPSFSEESVEIATDKSIMKEFFRKSFYILCIKVIWS